MRTPCRIVVTGARDWNDKQAVVDALIYFMSRAGDLRFVIIQGGAEGADALAAGWARERQIPCETFAADWKTHGSAAGPIRNRAMLEAGADIVLAFPGGDPTSSPGTWDTIHRAARMSIPVRIYPRVNFEGTVAR